MSKAFEHWNYIPSFREQAFEIAFGDDAINKGYTDDEVIAKLREFSDKSLWFEQNDADNEMEAV